MQQVNWTYVAIIHDDDTYGREAVDQLLSTSGQRYTCFPEVFPVDPQLTTDQMYQQIKRNVESLHTRSIPISGIVLFGGNRLGKTLLDVINDIYRPNSTYEVPKILASEGYWSVEQERLDINNVTKGLFMATPPIRKIEEFEEFEDYWMNNLLGNITAITENKYLSDVYGLVKNCDLSDQATVCAALTREEVEVNFPQPYVVQYAVQAAFAIARAIKGVYDSLSCSGINCQQLMVDQPKSRYLEFLENAENTVDFDNDFAPFRLEVFKLEPKLELNFTVKSSDPVYTVPAVLSYAVYNKQICKDNADKLCMEEVCIFKRARILFILCFNIYLVRKDIKYPNIIKVIHISDTGRRTLIALYLGGRGNYLYMT